MWRAASLIGIIPGWEQRFLELQGWFAHVMKVFHNLTGHAASCWHDLPGLIGAGDDHINALPPNPHVGAAPTPGHPVPRHPWELLCWGGSPGPNPTCPSIVRCSVGITSTGRSWRAWRLPDLTSHLPGRAQGSGLRAPTPHTQRGDRTPPHASPQVGPCALPPHLQHPLPREKPTTCKCLPSSQMCRPHRLGERVPALPAPECMETPLIYGSSACQHLADPEATSAINRPRAIPF